MQVPCQLYKKNIFNKKNAENQLKTGKNVKFSLFFTKKIRASFLPVPRFSPPGKNSLQNRVFFTQIQIKICDTLGQSYLNELKFQRFLRIQEA